MAKLSHMDRLRAAWKALAAKQSVHPTEGEVLNAIERVARYGIDEATRRADSDIGGTQEDIALGEIAAFNRILCEIYSVKRFKDESTRSHEDDFHAVG